MDCGAAAALCISPGPNEGTMACAPCPRCRAAVHLAKALPPPPPSDLANPLAVERLAPVASHRPPTAQGRRGLPARQQLLLRKAGHHFYLDENAWAFQVGLCSSPSRFEYELHRSMTPHTPQQKRSGEKKPKTPSLFDRLKHLETQATPRFLSIPALHLRLTRHMHPAI